MSGVAETALYVFQSPVGTVLCRNARGHLYHLSPERAVPDIVCDAAGRLSRPAPFRPMPLGDGQGFALAVEGGFLRADTDGGLWRRPTLTTRERFTLLSLETLDRRRAAARPALPQAPEQTQIARLIHQTFHGDAPPVEAAANIAGLKAMNPGWTYRYWSDRDVHDFIRDRYGWDMLKLYLRINPCYGAARADLFRYLCVYALGGVYLDVKAGSRRPLDEVLRPDDRFLLSGWRNGPGDTYAGWGLHEEVRGVEGGERQQWHVIAAAGHPFLQAVIEAVTARLVAYMPSRHGVGWSAVLRTTGPIAYTLAIAPLRDRYPYRAFDAQAAGLVYKAVDPPPFGPYGSYVFQDTPLVL